MGKLHLGSFYMEEGSSGFIIKEKFTYLSLYHL